MPTHVYVACQWRDRMRPRLLDIGQLIYFFIWGFVMYFLESSLFISSPSRVLNDLFVIPRILKGGCGRLRKLVVKLTLLSIR